jgi:hypothetical protein
LFALDEGIANQGDAIPIAKLKGGVKDFPK